MLKQEIYYWKINNHLYFSIMVIKATLANIEAYTGKPQCIVFSLLLYLSLGNNPKVQRNLKVYLTGKKKVLNVIDFE